LIHRAFVRHLPHSTQCVPQSGWFSFAHNRSRLAGFDRSLTIGYLEEFWTLDADGRTAYAGHRMVAKSAQAIGSEHRRHSGWYPPSRSIAHSAK
jgi:hypothetical protein